MALYQEDLAHVQDAGFSDFATRAAPALLALFAKAGIENGPVVDLGAGNGAWLRELSRAGFEPIGVEQSTSLARIARRTAPKAIVHRSSIYDFTIPPCRAVTAFGEIFNYLEGPAAAPRPLGPLFRRIAAALPTGGLFIFDALLDAPGPRFDYRTWREGSDWAVLVDVSENPRRTRVVRDIVTFRRIGGRYRRHRERHHLQVFRRTILVRQLNSAGFTIRSPQSPHFPNFPLAPRREAFLATKA